MFTRRAFVREATRAVAGVGLAPVGQILRLSSTAVRRTTPGAWLPDPTSADTFRALAVTALNAARDAGAPYADLRIGEQRVCDVRANLRTADLRARKGYGMRVLVDGRWGTAYGDVLTSDAVASVARQAVAVARGAAAVRIGDDSLVKLAPAAAPTGEWVSPSEVAPFSVPLDDHVRVLGAWHEAVASYSCTVDTGVRWEVDTRVVATSDGTLVTQECTRCEPSLSVSFSGRSPQYRGIGMRVWALPPATAGFEHLMDPMMPDRCVGIAEEAIRLGRLPFVNAPTEVGRYPVVFDGEAMATLLGLTLAPALDGDRVSGLDADTAGRSWLARRGDTVPVLSPLLTVQASRAVPSYTAVKWDDEGVAPNAAVLVERGHARGCLATRETASRLADGVGALRGFAVAPEAMQPVVSGGAHLAMGPAATAASIETLVRGISRGYLCYGGRCLPEPNGTSGLFMSEAGPVLEVRDGRPVAILGGIICQFQASRWWNTALAAVGDASTVVTTVARTRKGMPWQEVTQVISAPAVLIRDVDVRTDLMSR